MEFRSSTDDDRAAIVNEDGHLIPVLKGKPCELCDGTGLFKQPDRSVKACPRAADKKTHY